MKKIYLLIIQLSLCLSIYSQNISQTFPTVVEPSPQVSNFERYGNIPVGNATGVPEISIPICTVKSGNFEMPISLSYHASGIKVKDMSSWVGLGWSLMAGGYITRNIKGVPDSPTNRKVPDIGTFPNWVGAIKKDDDVNFLMNLLNNPGNSDYDTQPDEFSFNFLGRSGKFVLDRYYGIQYKYENMRIMFLDTYFEIKTEDGYTYLFKEVEGATYTQKMPDGTTRSPFQGGTVPVSWHLSTIITPINDSITFEYKKSGLIGLTDRSFTQIFGFRNVLGHDQGGCPYQGTSTNFSKEYITCGYTYVEEVYLTNIKFRGGKVVFESTNDRLDNPVGNKLNTIKMYDPESNIVKNIKLSYDYFFSDKGNNAYMEVGDDYRLKLLNIADTSPFGDKVHSFEYNPELLPQRHSLGIDLEGYYNGAENNTTLLYLSPGGSGDNGGYRLPNLQKMKACALTTIHYPTKGYMKYEYENHQAQNTQIGGLRIKTIKNYDSNGSQLEGKEYKYGNNEDGNGIISAGYFNGNYAPSKTAEMTIGCGGIGILLLNNLTCNYDYPIYSSPYGGVLYPEVNEYTIDGNGQHLGKTTYKYDYTSDSPSSDQIVPISYYSDNSELRGNLIEESKYDNNNTILTRKTYTYDTYKKNTVWSLVVKWDYQPSGSFPEKQYTVNGEFLSPYFDYAKWSWVERDGYVKKIKSLREVEHFGTDSVVSITDYSRDWKTSTYLLFLGLTSEKTTSSAGKLLETDYTYPDLTTPNGILSPYFMPIVEQKKYNNSVLFEDVKVSYSNFNNLYLPSMVQIKNNVLSDFRIEKEYHNYDSFGNPSYITKDDLTNVVYLWGYNGQYPVAEIKNATYSQATNLPNFGVLTKIFFNIPTDADINILSTTLRSILPQAQVTTYTYKLQVGITSKTDPRGVTTYYNYDSFNRLQNIKDKDGKIIQTFYYNYQH